MTSLQLRHTRFRLQSSSISAREPPKTAASLPPSPHSLILVYGFASEPNAWRISAASRPIRVKKESRIPLSALASGIRQLILAASNRDAASHAHRGAMRDGCSVPPDSLRNQNAKISIRSRRKIGVREVSRGRPSNECTIAVRAI